MLSRLVLILGFTVTALLLFSSVSLTLSKPIEDGTDNIDHIGLSSLKEQERKNEPAQLSSAQLMTMLIMDPSMKTSLMMMTTMRNG